MSTKPRYTITPRILHLIEQIGEAIGRAEASNADVDLRLRRINRVLTIHGSLAIEGNTLSREQIATILDNKTVIAPPREIQEIRNAIKAYDRYLQWRPARETDLLSAHNILMAGLMDEPGRYRRAGVGVMGAREIIHVAPPADRVPWLVKSLLAWLDRADEQPLILSSVFHYEFEFIHPFADGNGRLGRLWQTLILSLWKPLFANLPVESMIHARQDDYYEAILQSSATGESTGFVTFMLEVILQSLETFSETSDQVNDQVSDQVTRLLSVLRAGPKSTVELLAELGLSHRPTLRKNYLHPAIAAGLVTMTHPESPNAKNQKYCLVR